MIQNIVTEKCKKTEVLMRKEINCPFSILNRDIICEHKSADIYPSPNPTLHNHDGYELLLFLDGDANFVVESEAKRLVRGDLILINSYAFHGISLSSPNRYERVLVNIRRNLLQELGDSTTDLASCFNRKPALKLNLIHLDEKNTRAYIALAERLEDCLSKKEFGHELLAKTYLTELLIMICRYATTSEPSHYKNIMAPVVSKIFASIDAGLSEALTVELIAQRLHHNTDYISRVFKNETGSSLKHYINARKIFLAQQYLRQGLSPYDVCFMVGYCNYSSFSRRFSAQIGCSPKQYQLRCRSKSFADAPAVECREG